MSNTLTSQLSDEAQEALEFLQEKNIDVNRTINRIVMRAAQEEGWHIALVPGGASCQGITAVKESPPDVEASTLEPQPEEENTHLPTPVDPAPKVQPRGPDRPVEPAPTPVEKPFEPGVVLAATAQDQDDLPHTSSVVKKKAVEPVAEVQKVTTKSD
jgi:hypothetical protein